MKHSGAPTTSILVEDLLREGLVSGDFPPGSALRPAELAKRWTVSPGVVREALNRLSEQGLVSAVSNRGFLVRSLSAKELKDLTLARRAIETEALALAITEGDMDWEAAVVGAHHRLASISLDEARREPEVRQQWLDAHRAFHDKLYEACNNSILLRLCRSLGDAAEFYRRWVVIEETPQARDIPSEHRALLDAVLSRDVSGGTQSLAAHIERTSAALEHHIARDAADGAQ